MELREYWTVIARRWWLIAALVLLAFLVSFFFAPRTESRYVATIGLAISIQPEPLRPDVYNFDRFYSFQAAEFLVDDFGGLVQSQAFSQDVADVMNDPSITASEIRGSRSAQKSHRLLTITTTTDSPDKSLRIAEASVQVLQDRAPFYFAQLNSQDGVVRVLDQPTVQTVSGTQRTALDAVLRTALGLVAGLAIVFVLHYIDRGIYNSREVEQVLGLPVLGELPPDKLAS